MDIKELKSEIENKTLSQSLFILKYADNEYLSMQYAKNIALVLNLNPIYIDSLAEMSSDDDIFGGINNSLYIYKVNKLEQNILPTMKNLIVICQSVPDILAVDYIEMPKILEWQIEDYAKMRLPGLKSEEVIWLCQICKYDIYRIDQECKKLELFDPAMQEIAFSEMNMTNSYSDLTSLTIFNYIQAMMKKDLAAVNEMISDVNGVDIEATGSITLFHKQLKNMIDVKLNPHATAESLGMQSRQFNAIKYASMKFTESELIKMFDFITGLDYRLKNGELMFKADNRPNNEQLVYYITTQMLGIMLNKTC